MTTIKCPHCARQFADENAVYQHIKSRHGQKAAYKFGNRINPRKPKPKKQERTREPSMGELMAEAELNRMMGIENEDWIEEMLP